MSLAVVVITNYLNKLFQLHAIVNPCHVPFFSGTCLFRALAFVPYPSPPGLYNHESSSMLCTLDSLA